MRIALDARGVNFYRGTGIGTYTENLFKNLINIDNKNFYEIYWAGEDYSGFEKENSKIILSSRKRSHFFEEMYFPCNLIKENIDIYHIPQNGFGLNGNIKCAKVVTIHDLIPYIMPATVGKGYLSKFLKEMPVIMKLADAVITVSVWSKNDIIKYFPESLGKVFVTPLAADSKYKPLDREKCRSFLRKNYNIDKPFILYVGGFSERKNVKSLIDAFSKTYKKLPYDSSLVILGSLKDQGEELKSYSSSLDISENIIFTGFIPDNLLPVFYNAAEVFVYPSFYEGFGLPPLEAMSCGTATIASNVTSIPEIVKDGGILIDPCNTDSLSAAIEELMCDEKLRKGYEKKGIEISSKFSWKRTAELTLDVYNSIKL